MRVIDEPEERWIGKMTAALAATHVMARFGHAGVSRKADGSLVTEADTAMQAAMVSALHERYPGIPVLAEEQPAARQQALIADAADGVWCLDPLDGTTNFAAGMPLFAVSLALIRRGRVEFGLVHDPVRGETFSALLGGGARLNGHGIGDAASGIPLGDAIAVVDFKRLAAPLATRLAAAAPFRSQRSIGSVALDWCWLAARRFQLYLHGGQRLWDYAAGQLIAREAGVAVCLADSPDGKCGFALSLRRRVAIGAADEKLLTEWRAFLGTP